MNAFLEDLEELLEDLSKEAADYDDDDAADLALRPILVAFATALPPHRLATGLREVAETLERGGATLLRDRSKGVPSNPPTPPPPLRSLDPASVRLELPPFCWKCGGGYAAICLRFDERSGEHRPVCETHARSATPFERRPLG